MTDAAVTDLLKSLYPAHTFDWLEAETGDGGLGDLLDALGEEANDDGFALVDQLVKEMSPATTEQSLEEREASMGIERSKIALYGSTAQRQAQLVARFRESGTPTPDRILAAVQALTGPTAATLIGHNRAALRAVNTHGFGIVAAASGASATATVRIGDNAVASKAGAQFLINGTGEQGAFSVTFTSPTGQTFNISTVYTGGGDYYYYWPDFADYQITGTWTIFIDNSLGSLQDVQLDAVQVFVEGIGRSTFDGPEGLGANIFEWCILIEESVVAATYDRDTVRNLVRRWNPGHCRAFLCLFATTGSAGAICDNTNSLFDGCLFS